MYTAASIINDKDTISPVSNVGFTEERQAKIDLIHAIEGKLDHYFNYTKPSGSK